jgi:hypothetical protein
MNQVKRRTIRITGAQGRRMCDGSKQDYVCEGAWATPLSPSGQDTNRYGWISPRRIA